jgi:hypothetical protein
MIGFDELFSEEPRAGFHDILADEATALKLFGYPLDRKEALQADLATGLPIVAEPKKDFRKDEIVGLMPCLVEMEDIGDEPGLSLKKRYSVRIRILRTRYSGMEMPPAPFASM